MTKPSWKLVGLVVVVGALVVLAGCNSAGAGGGGGSGGGGSTGVDESDASQAFAAAFTAASQVVPNGDDSNVACLAWNTFTFSDRTVTSITFTNCTDGSSGIVINGTATLTAYSSGPVDWEGDFTLTNAPISSMTWTFSIAADGSTFTGEMTADGKTFQISSVQP
jgi:hypothetical protein